MPRQSKIKKSEEEINIENQIKALNKQKKALKEQLAIKKSKRQDQTIKRPAKEILKTDFRDAIPAEIEGIIEEGEPVFEEISVRLKNNFHDVILRYKVNNYISNDVNTYLDNISRWVREKTFNEWKRFGKFKLQINPVFLFYNSITGEYEKIHRYIKPKVILTSYNFEEFIDNTKSEFSSIIEEMEQKDSQWIFIKIISSDIFLYDVTDERANSYIKTPFKTQSIVNVQNKDNYCFIYSILAGIYYDIEETNRSKPYTYEKYINFENKTAELPNNKTLNFKDIEFPFKYVDIPKFEKLNPFLSIYVFGIKENTIDKIEPITQMSKDEKEYNIDLLLLTEETNNHYVLITKLANLLKDKEHKNYNHICRNCLNLFKTETAKDNHYNQCKNNSPQTIRLPKNKDYCFTKHYMKSKVPFIITFDFESTLLKLQTCKPR